LHEAFRILGLKSVHFEDDEGNNIFKGLEEYDAFSDWDRAPYTVS